MAEFLRLSETRWLNLAQIVAVTDGMSAQHEDTPDEPALFLTIAVVEGDATFACPAIWTLYGAERIALLSYLAKHSLSY